MPDEITMQGDLVVMRDGKVGTSQGCCCNTPCCLPDGTCSAEYATQEACEECTPEYLCFDEENPFGFPVADCSECAGTCEQVGTTGPCGTWRPGKNCETAGCNCANLGEETLLVRACLELDDPADIEAVKQHLEDNCYFTNVRYVFEPETASWAYYGTCCSPNGTVLVEGGCSGTFCGVPYQGLYCQENPLP